METEYPQVPAPGRWHSEPIDEHLDRPPTLGTDVDPEYACEVRAETPDEGMDGVTLPDDEEVGDDGA